MATYYYVASLCGLRLEGRTDAGIIEADGLTQARGLAEEEVGTKHPTATILALDVRPATETDPCAL